MTLQFILDENVVILAQRRENDRGEPDPTCLNLFAQIITICHTIVVDYDLWNQYQHQLSPLSQTQTQEGSLVLAVLDNASRMAGKIDFRNNAAPFPEEGSIPQGSQDDVDVVRLLVETGATLVTTDVSLRNDLNSCGVQETYSLQLLSPEEALGSL